MASMTIEAVGQATPDATIYPYGRRQWYLHDARVAVLKNTYTSTKTVWIKITSDLSAIQTQIIESHSVSSERTPIWDLNSYTYEGFVPSGVTGDNIRIFTQVTNTGHDPYDTDWILKATIPVSLIGRSNYRLEYDAKRIRYSIGNTPYEMQADM